MCDCWSDNNDTSEACSTYIEKGRGFASVVIRTVSGHLVSFGVLFARQSVGLMCGGFLLVHDMHFVKVI